MPLGPAYLYDRDLLYLGGDLDRLARDVDYDVVLANAYACDPGHARELVAVSVADLRDAVQLAVGLPEVVASHCYLSQATGRAVPY
jgi:hypothetical protein